MNDVTDILRDRMSEPAGLQRMAMISGAVHAILLTTLTLTSGRLLTRATDTPRSVMTITLGGGAPGPQNGGMTSIGGKAIQAQAPPEAAKRPEPVRAPAAKTPLMTLPKPGAKPTQAASTVVKDGPDRATGRTPTRGAETSPGNAVAETGVRGQGFGLSTGGGGGSGSRLDVGDFCCPEYIVTMVERIRGNWNARAGAVGEAIVVFTIERDGRLTNVALERSSNNPVLDLNAQKALYTTRQLPPLPGGFPNPTLTVHLNFQYKMIRILLVTAAAAALLTPSSQQQTTPSQTPPPQQPTELVATISSGDPGIPPRLAIPDFIALSNDAETVDAAKTIPRVLFDDLSFEREFSFFPQDIYSTIPAARSINDVPYDRWRELNADGVIVGTVLRTDTGVRVEVRLVNVRTRVSAFAKEYTGSVANKRLYAHTIADEIHQTQRGLRGVARTKLTFNSDRDGERVSGTVEKRGAKEIYISDYDGENQRRVTTGFSLNITSTWSPDGRAIAYTSYQRGLPNIFVSNIFQGTRSELTSNANNNVTPAWSPDGTRLCFASNRDGNFELYVMNRDGSGLRRLTNHPAGDITPTWSPSGTQIAFTSDRSGSPQIYMVGADGLGLQRVTSEPYADRPTWSPAPYNEIAYAARTGPGNDLKVIDLATKEVRQLTHGEGTNESPTFAPNGRHIAFTSTRSGRTQIFTIARDGTDVRQVTRTGNNYQPDWSK